MNEGRNEPCNNDKYVRTLLRTRLHLARFIVRRLFLAIFVLIGVLTVTFILSHSLGNPLNAWLGRAAGLHPELAKLYAAKYHLNDPIWVQYYYYVIGLLTGNLGYSPSKGFEPVAQVLGQTLPNTIQISFFAIMITILLGVVLGVLAALYHRKPVEQGIRSFYLAGYSSPSFLVALVLLIVFVTFLHVLPSGGAVDITIPAPSHITYIPMLDSLLEGNLTYFGSALVHVILPSMALALTTFGLVTRVLRSSLLTVMHSNYIRTARAKGLDERTVFFKHGLRNALIPVVTVSSIAVTWLITGTVFVENIFSYPGVGQYVVTALIAKDYPGILATTLIFAVIIVLANLVADILYVVVDPQIRLS
jgi:ABC-type dipeptide/oligopeptide/nickel transport system permease component